MSTTRLDAALIEIRVRVLILGLSRLWQFLPMDWCALVLAHDCPIAGPCAYLTVPLRTGANVFRAHAFSSTANWPPSQSALSYWSRA
jgi:hypothetical protein